MSNQYDYIEAGFRVFGLHGVENGVCGCGDKECEALFKHPRVSNWQSVPDWSDDQLEVMEQMGHFDTGFGVLCTGYLVIDVDARNGGVASFAKLLESVPEAGNAAFVVNTGSGGGSQHHYFRAPEGVAMLQTLKDYPGIDLKTSGFVVGAGSIHASGNTYEVERGDPSDVTDAPAALVDLLRKPSTYRTRTSHGDIDISMSGIQSMLDHVDNKPGIDYEDWIRVGMAIHHTTGGSSDGYMLWDTWSMNSDKYSPGQMEKKWHSFGKAAQPVTIGTLVHMARDGGYETPIEFVYSEQDGEQESEDNHIDTAGVDLKRPPGLVGDITRWINDQCRYPVETLAVAAGITAVGNLAGMRVFDAEEDMTPNIIAFCVAGSTTGKEAVNQAFLKIMRIAGVAGAVHGAFKSEQELVRNLVRHQAAFYAVDELGIVLKKLKNAQTKGGASYLEGLVGLIMSVFSKANGYLPITGDLKEEIRNTLIKELAQIRKRIDGEDASGEGDAKRARMEKECERIEQALNNIESGLENPFLSILGFTTPVTFDDLIDFEQATNGFLGRSMIFKELETNPRRKTKFQKRPMSSALKAQIANLYRPGEFDTLETQDARVEYRGDKAAVRTDDDALLMLDRVYETFHEMAEQQKSATGLEAIPRRGYEMVSKVSIILAIGDGVRTKEHVRWAFKLAYEDCKEKIRLAYANDRADDPVESRSAYATKVLGIVSKDHGETFGVINNRLRAVPKDSVKSLLDEMVDKGQLLCQEVTHPTNGRRSTRYFAAK